METSNEKTVKTLNQERASFAMRELNGRDKKYKTYCKKLPALIITNGLIPTLIFLESKSETKGVSKSVIEWLKQRGFSRDNKGVLEYLLDSDFSTLRLATMEALSLANWLKRMAEAVEDQGG